MARRQFCDVCGKQVDEVVAKLYLAPVIPGKTRTSHNNYSASMDVGTCCVQKVHQIGDWQRRKSSKQYHASRRLRGATDG